VKRSVGAVVPALTVALALAAGPALAWPAPLMQSLARDARRLLPVSLGRLMADRDALLQERAQRFPPELAQAMAFDLGRGALAPGTIAALDAHTALAVAELRAGHVSEGVIAMGALLRIPADLSDPVLSIGAAGYPAGVTSEYYAFVEQNLDKIPVVLDNAQALRLPRTKLSGYWQGLLDRSRNDSPVIRLELFQGGRVISHRTLDYRSPVFGVASLSYSRAVTAIAATWLAVWREANGDVTRLPVPVAVAPRDGGSDPLTATAHP
jgi:ribosome modulation factor